MCSSITIYLQILVQPLLLSLLSNIVYIILSTVIKTLRGFFGECSKNGRPSFPCFM